MCTLVSFDYAIIRVVPRVEREEFVNVGLVLFCPERRFLQARLHLQVSRLTALAPDLEMDEVARRLALIPWVCRGDPAMGDIARLPQAGRFHWLVTPRSSVIQPSPVHSGLCHDPATALERILERDVFVQDYRNR